MTAHLLKNNKVMLVGGVQVTTVSESAPILIVDLFNLTWSGVDIEVGINACTNYTIYNNFPIVVSYRYAITIIAQSQVICMVQEHFHQVRNIVSCWRRRKLFLIWDSL